MSNPVKTCTIEKRGGRYVAMAWSDRVADGPVEVRLCDDLQAAQAQVEASAGRKVTWREARGDELKHGVVSATDL